ncbi:MAG: FMN-binding negative transcriptional regulator [Isosphaeraceae bacterium]
MYIPASFAETDAENIREFMRRHSFAVLTSQGPSGLFASHLPLLVEDSGGLKPGLFGHMARANPQWREIVGEVMAVFSGPHAYISPTWYEEEGTVPTWNYVAVHAYGIFQVVEERAALLEILRRSVRFFEGSLPDPWVFDESAPNAEKLLKGIVGLRIEITRLEAKWKLGQNHTETRRRRVIQALNASADEASKAVAALMEEELEST